MSELMNVQTNQRGLRRQLLSTVSTLAVLGFLCDVPGAIADDTDRPTVWIELGADLQRTDIGQQTFAPAFIANNPGSTAFDPVSPAEAQRSPAFSFGQEGEITFQPDNSNWVISAAVRYGRANASRHVHQEANNAPHYQHVTYGGYISNYPPETRAFQTKNFFDALEKQSSSHAVVDFQAGEDVGLGLFGRQGTSVFSVGVQFAQFTSNMQSNLKARPDFAQVELHVPTPGHPNNHGTLYGHHYHQYIATAVSDRSFSGIGPSLSWNASAPVLGSTESGQLSLDWGANAAILFGRQKARVQHQTTAQYFASAFAYDKYPAPAGAGYHHPLVTRQRAHTLVVPNAGGFASISYHVEDFRIAVGYRGDFFFGAMDTGFDAAKKSTIGFYGPFATVSIGLGG